MSEQKNYKLQLELEVSENFILPTITFLKEKMNVDINTIGNLQLLPDAFSKDVLYYAFKFTGGETVVEHICKYPTEEALYFLVTNGFDVSSRDYLILKTAAKQGYLSIFKHLKKEKFDFSDSNLYFQLMQNALKRPGFEVLKFLHDKTKEAENSDLFAYACETIYLFLLGYPGIRENHELALPAEKEGIYSFVRFFLKNLSFLSRRALEVAHMSDSDMLDEMINIAKQHHDR